MVKNSYCLPYGPGDPQLFVSGDITEVLFVIDQRVIDGTVVPSVLSHSLARVATKDTISSKSA